MTLYGKYDTIGHSLLRTSVTMRVAYLANSGAGSTSTSGGTSATSTSATSGASASTTNKAAKASSTRGLGLSSILLAVAFAAVGFMASM